MLHVCLVKPISATRWLKYSPSRFRNAYAPRLQQRRNLLTLAIETSCDDTCVAILSKPSRSKPDSILHFNQKITSKNTGKGGIVPSEALSSHQVNLAALLDESLASLPDATGIEQYDHRSPGDTQPETIRLRDGRIKQKPDFVSVTRGPGMFANLGVGLNTAKGLATAWQVPLVGVHHMQAHALTSRMVDAMSRTTQASNASPASTSPPLTPSFPFLTLLVSGGHTMLVHSHHLTSHKIIATTADVAIGDELDKCGRLILPDSIKSSTADTSYAKYLSEYAFPTPQSFESWPIPASREEELNKPLNQYGWTISTPMTRNREAVFSFSGISSTVKRIQASRDDMSDEERIHLARTCLSAAFECLGSRTIIALQTLSSRTKSTGTAIPTPKNLIVSGGVASNPFLRFHLRRMLDLRGFKHVKLIFPPVEFCTDNAAMIAWAGMEMFEAGYSSDMACQPLRSWSLDPTSPDGGILGVGGWKHLDQ